MTMCATGAAATNSSRKLPELFEQVEALESAGIGALSAGGHNLPLRRLAIRSRVSGVHCQTTIAQVFANPLREFVEATYIFPLPGRFAVTACTMHVGGRVIEAELQERSQARATYNQAIAAGHRAAIAEEERSETFTLRVGNIPPLEEVTVELTLVGSITVDHGEGTLRIPLVVAPRYVEWDLPTIPMKYPMRHASRRRLCSRAFRIPSRYRSKLISIPVPLPRMQIGGIQYAQVCIVSLSVKRRQSKSSCCPASG
jgi:hypothetical protein